jgi:methyl coenzyme M reductase alpha subunit
MDGGSFVTKEVVGRRKYKKAMTRAAVHTQKRSVCTSAANQTRSGFLYSIMVAEEIIQRLGYPFFMLQDHIMLSKVYCQMA